MFPNLEAEMARYKITQNEIAKILGITPTTLSFKLNGKSSLSLKECVEIKNHWITCLQQKRRRSNERSKNFQFRRVR